jgi:hypothetical protein
MNTVVTSASEIINSDHFFYLYERWQDEQGYEDIDEYGKSIEKNFGVTVLKSSGNPFLFTIELEDKTQYEIGVNQKGRSHMVGVMRQIA